MRRAALALLLLAPTAAALDELPGEARVGPREATLVVRAAGPIWVRATAPVDAALAGEAFAPAPVELRPAPETAWHGLPGAVEVRLRRADPTQAVRVELDDGGTGVALDWPAEARTPAPGTALAAAAALLAASRRAR